MPKLLVLTQTHNPWGGIESWMSQLMPVVAQSGWDVEYGLAQGASHNDLHRFLEVHPYIERWSTLDGRVGTPPARQSAISRVLRRAHADVVMPIALGDAIPALRNLRRRGLQTRWLSAVHSSHLGTLADLVENRDILDVCGLVSGLLYRWSVRFLGTEPVASRWLRNGVPEPLSRRARSETEVLRVGYVGRLEGSIKRAGDLPQIARAAVDLGLSIRLTVVGDGPERAAVAAGLAVVPEWNDYSIEGYLSRDELYARIYPSLDCLLLTSSSEGSPLVVLEAMHHGVVPVVSRFHGHASEGLLQPDSNCLTFPIGDPRAAALQLQRIAKDRNLLESLSLAASADVSLYSETRMTTEWLSALEAAAKAEPAKPRKAAQPRRTAFGRLDRLGLPAPVTNLVRRTLRRRYPHASGFEEWPGSLSEDSLLQETIAATLSEIEAEQVSRLYSRPT